MNFLSPAFLIGLPLLAVPVVIHLLSRRQQKKISWGAMRFLMQAATRKRRLWQLTDLLLLLLRTAAFLFFILALARPLLPSNWLGGAVPREVILVLDQSLSMTRKIGGASAFELQIQEANGLLDDLTGKDSIRVLLAGESPEWLTPEPLPVSAGTVRKLRAELDALQPTLGAADLLGAVREAVDLEAAKDKSARIIAVISDGQRFGWRMDERPVWAAVQTRLEQSALPTTVALQRLARDQAWSNLSVNRIETSRAFGAIDQSLAFTAMIQNHSPAASAPALLNWTVSGVSAGAATVPELAPGASTTLRLSHAFAAAGQFDVTCHLEASDDLPGDNEAHLLVEIYERLPILLVEDPASAEALENDAPFVLAALGSRRTGDKAAWRSVFEPTVIEPAALNNTDLSRFRCVILANLRTLEPASVQKLESFVQTGGGVWIALGSQADEQFFNDQMYRGGLGLAPLKLTSPIGDPNDREKFFSIRAASDSHPATALLADFQRLDLDRARVYRRHQFDPFSGKDVSILLQAQGGEPVAVERRFGRGRVLVQGIPLGVSWSTLPLCQAYVALLHEWLWYLSEPNLPRRNLPVGEAIVQSAGKAEWTADLTLPDQRKVELTSSGPSGGAQFRFPKTRLPGEYVLDAKTDGDARTTTRFYVQRNPQESELKPLADADAQQMAAIKGFQPTLDLEAIHSPALAEPPKHPLEGWLLIAIACVLLGETLLAGWTNHRRILRVKPATMEGWSRTA
jgi:hypothetical protein